MYQVKSVDEARSMMQDSHYLDRFDVIFRKGGTLYKGHICVDSDEALRVMISGLEDHFEVEIEDHDFISRPGIYFIH